MKLNRYAGNPILSPHPDHPWEDLAVFNPAAWYDDASRDRCCCSTGRPNRIPNTSATSGWRPAATAITSNAASTEPVLGPSVEGFDGATIQDPRIIKIGEWFYVTYACRHYPFGQFWIPGGRDPYVTPALPARVPALPPHQRHAHRAGDDQGLQDLDPRRLAHRSAARRPRCHPLSRERSAASSS